jgi:ABC-type sugar transport system substrate-binding protein
VLTKSPAVKLAEPSTDVAPGSHKIAVIATGLATPGASNTAVFVQQAIKLAGWTAPATYDGKFEPTVQSGYIQTALAAGAQGLILISITPSTVASAIQQAEAKKVPVVCILCGPPASFSQFPGVIGVEPSPTLTGQAQALYAVSAAGPQGKIYVYEDGEFLFTAAQNTAAVAEIKSICSGCTVTTEQMKAGDEQVPGIPVLSGVLASHPAGTINVIIAPYDDAAANFATLLQQRGRTEIGVVGYAALPDFFTQIKAGTPPGAKADVSIPLPYMSYAAVDELARALAKQPTWDANNLGVSLVTTANVSQYNASDPYTSPGFDPATFFAKLWGK